MGVPKISGIYQIYNLVDGRRYVGSSIDMLRRWYVHKSNLRLGRHDNEYLQRAWDKYGEESFVFSAIHLCEQEDLAEYEGQFIRVLECCERATGYNLDPIINARTVPSKETRAKISEAHKGRTYSPETIKRMSEARKGKAPSPETRLKMSNSHKGSKHSEATLAKFRSRTHTEETKAKQSAWHTGKAVKEETKEKLRKINSGKKHSEETRLKIGNISRGRKFTPEHKAKLGAAIKAGWARRKASLAEKELDKNED